MKRTLAVLLTLAMLIGSVALFASCGAKPQLDLEKAEEALEDRGYDVNYNDDAGDDDPTMEESLYAYDGDGEWLTIVRFADTTTAKLRYQELKLEYDYEIDEIELEIKMLKNQLKKYKKELDSDEIDDIEDEIKELEDELKDLKKENVFGRSGKVVWYGTTSMVEATK